MEFTIDNAISTYYSTLDGQNSYWSLYSGVAFGLLAYLGAIKAKPSLIRVIILGFIIFSFSNLVNICSQQSSLLVISDGIIAYLEKFPEKIPEQFQPILMNLKRTTSPIWQVALFHLIATTGFSVALFFAGSISPSNSTPE